MLGESMRVLIVGSKGQLGYELLRTVPAQVVVHDLDLPELDVTDAAALLRTVADFKPTHIINAAAYTAVDHAQANQANAFAVNEHAARTLAQIALSNGCRLIHVSTDFVFDGLAGRPYLPIDLISPLSVYGQSKAQGDIAVLESHPSNSFIVRTAWVYSAHGGNFVKSIIKLLREKDQLRIIADQIGTPTWAGSLAQCIWTFAPRSEVGIWHFTDAGVASWYDLAVAVAEEALALGLINQMKPIAPIRTEDYPTPAKRPSFSVLDKTATWAITGPPNHWRQNLRRMLSELPRN